MIVRIGGIIVLYVVLLVMFFILQLDYEEFDLFIVDVVFINFSVCMLIF